MSYNEIPHIDVHNEITHIPVEDLRTYVAVPEGQPIEIHIHPNPEENTHRTLSEGNITTG